MVGPENVAIGVEVADMSGLTGTAAALVSPTRAEEVAEVVSWCYEHDVAMIPVGGRTGLCGGCVPSGEAVCIDLSRMATVRSFDPLLWRMEAEAGVTTATVARLARENGLLFPPDPGAAEQSMIGGNIACNAGGPHAFKYGTTNVWVSGVEAVIAPGELVRFGGPVRKDVAGYDLRGLMVGSEGTLGIVTAAWLRLVPAPEAQIPLAGFYGSVREGCDAIERVLASSVVPAAIEYLDGPTLRIVGPGFPGEAPPDAAFAVIAEAESEADAVEIREALGATVQSPPPRDLWRWRDGVGQVGVGTYGDKLSEDIAVPVDRLAEAVEAVIALGERRGIPTCSWGHAGDGNVHATFLFAKGAGPPEGAVQELFDLAVRLGGTASGEHGIGTLKRGQLRRQWAPGAVDAHRAIKSALDPKGLFNPGKKEA
jgi:FAD/FMN-containing dehydrogenase